VRASGADQDWGLAFVPLVVLIGMGMYFYGSPRDILRMLDQIVMSSLYWLRGFLA
jgi:hypothetical protein